MERLDKILSGAGWGRKEARTLIGQGRVTVDGVAVAIAEAKFGPEAVVAVDGAAVERGHTYLMLYKPAGVVSATADNRERTVLDLLPPELRRRGLFPVGRLDKDTTGLLLLTDDGAMAHDLLSPKKHVDKTYFVEVDGVLDPDDETAFAAGITLADGTVCLPARLRITAPDKGLVTVREGKYHQVKRMCAARGKPVKRLERVAFGPLTLSPELERGCWRALTAAEVATLRALTAEKTPVLGET